MNNSNNKYVTYDEIYFTDIEKQIISAFQDGSSLLLNIDIPCSKLIDLITVDDMLKQYITIHETVLEHTVEHLYEVFIEDKILI